MSAPDVQLAVLPGTTHLGVMMERAGLVATFVIDFFDKAAK